MSSTVLNWDDGRLISLAPGQTARCSSLKKGALYVVLIYNTAQHAQMVPVTVVWSNDVPPAQVKVPSTTGEAGPANLLFVSGDDTDYIALSLAAGGGGRISALVVSTVMPTNDTGIHNLPLPSDGTFKRFRKYTRYHAAPPAPWTSLEIQNLNNQFICVQMQATKAAVIVVNMGRDDPSERIDMFGPTANTNDVVTVITEARQTYSSNTISGGSGVWVWMNADSAQNSEHSKIVLQSLALMQAMFLSTGIPQATRSVARFAKRKASEFFSK